MLNSTVHNSWPTNRQQQARLQAPASGRGTSQEACKSVGRKGMVIRNNKQQKKRRCKEIKSVSMWEVREQGTVLLQKCRVLLGPLATKESSSLLWESATGSSSAHVLRETLPAFGSGRCLPPEQNPRKLCLSMRNFSLKRTKQGTEGAPAN